MADLNPIEARGIVIASIRTAGVVVALPVQPDAHAGGWFSGVNGELSYLPRRFDETQW